MVITKRERLYLSIIGVLAGLFLLQYMVIGPWLSYRTQMKNDLATATVNYNDAQRLLIRRRNHEKEWKALLASSLKPNPSEAESQVLHLVRAWVQEAGLGLDSLKSEHTAQDKDTAFQQISFYASGTGSMASVARMLWRLETAPIPLHVNSVQITPRKEATDDLTVQLSISTLCLNPEPEKVKAPPVIHAEDNP